MVDALTKLRANLAMVHSVGSIIDDGALDDVAKATALGTNAVQYADYVGCPAAEAASFVGGMAKRMAAAAASSLVPKPREKLPHEQEDWSGLTPDPALVGEKETKKMRHATNAEMLKLVQGGLAEEVRKIRADNPRLSESQARSRIYAENPGFYDSLRKMAHGPENEMAKRSSSAETEFMAKVDEVKKAHPNLTEAQAYSKAYTDRSNAPIVKRMRAEQRGEA